LFKVLPSADRAVQIRSFSKRTTSQKKASSISSAHGLRIPRRLVPTIRFSFGTGGDW
jgi:hypothetical protein